MTEDTHPPKKEGYIVEKYKLSCWEGRQVKHSKPCVRAVVCSCVLCTLHGLTMSAFQAVMAACCDCAVHRLPTYSEQPHLTQSSLTSVPSANPAISYVKRNAALKVDELWALFLLCTLNSSTTTGAAWYMPSKPGLLCFSRSMEGTSCP